MKKISMLAIPAVAIIASLAACNDSSTIGSSIVQDRVQVIVDSAFTVTGRSVSTEKVQSRTVSQLIGLIDAPGYGKLSSDVVMQFMPSSQLDTNLTKASDIDSLVMYMYMSTGEYVGDSIVPMGFDVYRLTKNLPSPIYSNFDPEGYYDATQPLATKIYNISNESLKLGGDTVYATGVELSVKLPRTLAVELFDAYKTHPEYYQSPSAFVNNVFKGLYVKNSFGSGRLMRTTTTLMSMYYHYYDQENDSTIYGSGNYFAVTPEVISNNDIAFQISPALQQRIDAGSQIVAAPVGMELTIKFPAVEIMNSYKSSNSSLSVLNTVSFAIPASVISNEFKFGVPNYLLMVLAKDREEFFAKNQLPDNKTSFYATYDSNTGQYTFGDMRDYINLLLEKSSVSEEDYTFNLVPVMATFESNSNSSYYYYYGTQQQTLATITPYMSAPVMSELFLDKAKIKLTYSTQSIEK